ncbi:MAG: prenyltransferase/squalene oxidase repeat-containing protein [Deltaproteobacteria bacterium]
MVTAPEPLDLAQAALARGRAHLLALQGADGAFEDVIDVGVVSVATQLLLDHHLGRLTETERLQGLAALAAAQGDDGSFTAHPGATTGSPVTTTLGLAVLERLGADDDRVRAASRYVRRHDGERATVEAFERRGDVTALFLARVGALDAAFLPKLPLSVALAPGFERLIDGRVHAGNLMALLVVLALGEDLRARPKKRSLLGAMIHGAVDGLQRTRAVEYLCGWQNSDGSFNASCFPTQLMTLGFLSMGLAPTDDPVRRSLGWLDRQKRVVDGVLVVQAIPNDIWSTALGVLALADATPRRGQHDGRIAAVEHLLLEQIQEPQPRANQRQRDAIRTGGWAFQRGNPTMPDCDDAGLVLAALGRHADGGADRRTHRAIDDGIAWLRAMQNPDGGWAAYVWNLPSKTRGPMFVTDPQMPSLHDPAKALSLFLSPPPEHGDPATEGVTARVLMGLGACGVGRDDPAVCRAIDFLRAQQCPNGAFWGRWMTCYLPCTSTVLLGLAAVGEDLDEPYVRRAIEWVRSTQNADGGFGEHHDAFRDPSAAGRGPSMPPVTALVVAALVACGDIDVVASRAVDYLVRTQREDGGWSSEGWVNPFVPPDTFYRYDFQAHVLPVWALSRWVRR